MRSDIIDHRLSSPGRLSPARLLSPAVVGSYLSRLWQTHRERRALAELEPRLLRDIGIDPIAAAHEVERPFWALSAHHDVAFRRRLNH
jgi:uncharacterized protein YjiS (DUF1127 family)